MFKIDQAPKFWQPVKFTLAGEEEQSFKVRFNVLPVSQVKDVDLNDGEQVHRFMDNVIGDVDDIEDEAGRKVPHSKDLVNRLLDQPHIRGAIMKAYFAGVAEAARGN